MHSKITYAEFLSRLSNKPAHALGNWWIVNYYFGWDDPVLEALEGADAETHIIEHYVNPETVPSSGHVPAS